MLTEKRTFIRKKTNLNGILVCDHSPHHVNVTNCSENGMYISLETDCSPCNPNIEIFVEGINKNHIESDSRVVGKIVRALQGNDKSYFFGVKLIHPQAQYIDFIKNL